MCNSDGSYINVNKKYTLFVGVNWSHDTYFSMILTTNIFPSCKERQGKGVEILSGTAAESSSRCSALPHAHHATPFLPICDVAPDHWVCPGIERHIKINMAPHPRLTA